MDDDGRDLVEAWTVGMLTGLGVPHDDATMLTGLGVSWHEAERLIARGCEPELVRAILG